MKNKFVIYLIFVIILSASCKVKYSFSGISISPDVKTVQIDYFPNNAPLVNPTLSNTFQNSLQDIFLNRTSLSLVKEDGDLQLEGEISKYEQSSVAPVTDPNTGVTVAGKIRLTIAVKVRFYNNLDEKQNFEKEFSNFADAPGSETLSGAAEQTLVEEILDRIINDIFNASVAQW